MQRGFAEFDINNMKKFGRFYGASFMGFPELNVCDMDMLRQIFIEDFAAFPNRVISDFFIGNQTIRKNMVNVMTDQHWKDLRRTITPAFTPRRLEKMLPIMERCIRTAERIIDDCISRSNGLLDTKKFFSNLTMDIIAQCAFGVELSIQEHQDSLIPYHANKIFNLSFVGFRIMFLVLFPNIARLAEKIFKFQLIGNSCDAFFEDILRKIVEERRKCPREKDPDFLQLLMDSKEDTEVIDRDEELMHDALASGKKIALTDMELIAQGYLFLVTGYETTANTLQFISYCLASNPQVQEIAHAQVMDTVGHKKSIGYADLMKMPYLEQVMNETLRMYPPVPRNDRKCESDITVGGVKIEKGTFVYLPTYAIHYNEHFYPNPEKFDPERFSRSEKANRDPVAFAPFGIGPRNCIGLRLAQMEIRLILAHLLRSFKFSVPEEFQGKLLELDTRGMTRPKTPVFVTVSRRNH
uniref:Cytochrome P450 3A24 n=1 Tax=Ascaris suum TaxID=6253 RepID=F1L055_ASCSU